MLWLLLWHVCAFVWLSCLCMVPSFLCAWTVGSCYWAVLHVLDWSYSELCWNMACGAAWLSLVPASMVWTLHDLHGFCMFYLRVDDLCSAANSIGWMLAILVILLAFKVWFGLVSLDCCYGSHQFGWGSLPLKLGYWRGFHTCSRESVSFAFQ